MQHPRGPPPVIRTAGGERTSEIPNASLKGGSWRPTQAEMLSPGVSLPGSFVTVPSPEPPVGRP